MRKGFDHEHNFQENHPHFINNPQQPRDHRQNELCEDKQADSLYHLVDAITNLLESQLIQQAALNHKTKSTSPKLSFSVEKSLLPFKDFICYLKEIGDSLDESTLWILLKILIYGCSVMEDCFIVYEDFNISTLGIYKQENDNYVCKLNNPFLCDAHVLSRLKELDRIIDRLPLNWKKEEVLFNSINRLKKVNSCVKNSDSERFSQFLIDFNFAVKKSVRALFGLVLRVSICEFDRNNDSKMRILKRQLLSMLKERGYSDLFIEFCVGILFTKDVNSIKTFSELRFMIDEVILSSKSSFDSFSNTKNENTFNKGLRHLKGTSLDITNGLKSVRNLISVNEIVPKTNVIYKEKTHNQEDSQSKRLLKYKSSDETFNYQSYIMKTNDQVPELSEIMAKRRTSDNMYTSNDNDTLKSLASYLRKGEFDSNEKKVHPPVKSVFNKLQNNDTLNLTLGNRSNDYLLDKPNTLNLKEISQDSDIEVSGLNQQHTTNQPAQQQKTPKDTYNNRKQSSNFDQLMSNFNNELQVDAELDSINQKINKLKERIQQHKKNLSNRNNVITKPLSNIKDFNNNLDDKNSENSPNNYFKRSRPVSVVRNRENNPEYLLHNQKEDTYDSRSVRQENQYIPRYNLKESTSSIHKRSLSYTPNTRLLSSNTLVPQQPAKNEYSYTTNRQRNQSMGRNNSRSSSYKRRIKLESVGTSFFKELVTKDGQKSEYDNYYSN